MRNKSRVKNEIEKLEIYRFEMKFFARKELEKYGAFLPRVAILVKCYEV